MTLEEQFYKEVTPEGKNNYVLTGQAKVLLLICKAIDELKTTKQITQTDKCPSCGGKGKIQSYYAGEVDCVACSGRGTNATRQPPTAG